MQVICISRGTLGRGKELAELVAKKLGFACLSREELIEAAIAEGIQVGKLEMAMLKPQAFTERMAVDKEHYLAFCRAHLCERAAAGNLVYHGRTGHLLLPGISHVLRVRVVSDVEDRIRAVQDRMGLDRKKALGYVEDVDADRSRWVKSMYGVSLDDVVNYDLIVNLQQMSLENSASAMTSIAQLPDFQMTPASRNAMLDLQLGANARLALARDERTSKATFTVRADSGVVTVSYLPQDSQLAGALPEVLRPVPGISDARITMATTNILWIQQEFQPHTETYDNVVEIATTWNAAVQLVRLVPEQEAPADGDAAPEENAAVTEGAERQEYNGGIEDDIPETAGDGGGLQPTLDELAEIGRSGGGRTVYGDQHPLVDALDRQVPYALVVVGDVFLSKGHAARQRATRDLGAFLSDSIKAPVVTVDELGRQYLFGKRDLLQALVFLVLVVVIYFLVFTNQDVILEFLANSGWYAEAVEGTVLARLAWLPKVIISAAVFIVVPLVAYLYGTVASSILKLVRME
jgi:cytidylate kinase